MHGQQNIKKLCWMLNEDVAVRRKTQKAKYKFPEVCWHPLATVLLQKVYMLRVLTSVYILKHEALARL